ncbi:ABC transporter permease [Endozoicomonas montiporae]
MKYRSSLLGAAWSVLNPLAMIIVYTVVFSQVMHARLPNIDHSMGYSVFLCAGILTWGLFSEIASRAQNVFIGNANLLKKINFPRLCLPVTVVCNALLNFLIIFSIFTVFLIVTGLFPGFVYFALIPVLLVMVSFAIGLGITLGVLNVFFRDIGHLFEVILQFWFWFTPIVYPPSILPEWVKPYMVFNPLAGVIKACQTILVDGVWPDWYGLLPALSLGILLCGLGFTLFRKHASEMVDEL